MEASWFDSWFNEDYLNLYAYHDEREAERQVNFIMERLSMSKGSKILDLGCGTGRHALIFAQEGYQVTGLDLSPLFVQKAQENAKKFPNLSLNFLRGDMRDLSRLPQYDVILSLFTSFGYFSDQENCQVLQQIHQHLYSKGKFLLDYLNPGYVLENLIPEQKKIVAGDEVVIRYTIEDDKVVKRICFPQRTYQEEVKLYNRQTLEKFLKMIGFEVIEFWGDYQGRAWSAGSPRQLIYCLKQ